MNAAQLEAWSQQQHGQYLALFGSDPVDGSGFQDQCRVAEQVTRHVQDTRAGILRLQFSTAVTAAYASATSTDHVPLAGAAAALGVFASVAEESRRINLDGAEAIAANARSEAAAVGAVPDPDSPAGLTQILSYIGEHQARAVAIVERAAAAAQAAGARAEAAGGQDDASRVQAVDHHSFKEEEPPAPGPPAEGIPPEGVRPPVEGPLTEGPASKPSRAAKGGRSLYDQDGGEWRYYPGDEWRHNPHWDYKPRPGSGSPWENIPIDGLPPVHTPIVTGFPPWLPAPNQVDPAPAGAPQNPLLAPFPGAVMPATPEVPAPATGLPDLIPHISAPHIDAPPAGAGEATTIAGGGMLLLLLLAALAPG